MNPKMDYENQIWKNEQPLEKAIQEYTARIESYHELSAKDKEIIRAYLTDISENDVVKETTNTLIAAMYWNV
jgi:argininosuccinate lyase